MSHRPPSSTTVPELRLRNQPTTSLPNLRTVALHQPTDRMPDLPSNLSTSTTSSSPPSVASDANYASELQRHLYASFLEGKTADIALRIHGSWHALYKLHRVVLIQAGFFKSLFTAGFVESMHDFTSPHRGPKVVDIVFDDPNITRAAFEICIARLYGGGPPIFIPPSLIPTPVQPLTPTAPFITPKEPSHPVPCPANHHPASPHVLLSLLATAVFLSIPSIAAQTLQALLTTIGPRTVLRYLDFATGHGIGEPDEEEPEAAVGLEQLAELLSIGPSRDLHNTTPNSDHTTQSTRQRPEVESIPDPDIPEAKKEGPSSSLSDLTFDTSLLSEHSPSTFYGGVSNKIGEAVVCWITRWGGDMLRYEEESLGPVFSRYRPDLLSPQQYFSSTRKRATTVPSHSSAPIQRVIPDGNLISGQEFTSPQVMPLIWRRGGLNAKWVRRLLSSDALFVRGEKERYNMARSVVELRRREGVLREEEDEWRILFTSGIYYPNMSLDELMLISKDTSTITGEAFVPLQVLQSAHWNQSLLQHHIKSHPVGVSPVPQSPSMKPKELGLALSTDEATESSLAHAPSVYFPVPEDSSSRLGDNAGLENASMDQLFDLSAVRRSPSTGNVFHASEANCFGLEQQAFTPSACKHGDPKGKARWTPYPPLRFGVEFWDIDALKEKSRLHSQTIWYAGSLWNVYVQVVRKKGVQLGVYLHRQSSVDPIPPSSAPLLALNSSDATSHAPSAPVRPLSPPSPTPTPHSTPASPSRPSSLPSSYSSVHIITNSANTIPATAPPAMPSQPYRDSRPSVGAYFTIACASATGASLTKFTSAPDVFSISQSWGWKSSTLRTEEYLGISEEGNIRSDSSMYREISLRATIVLGIV